MEDEKFKMENHHLVLDPEVVGIALVVEEVGKGSNLVFKYPLAPPIKAEEDETIAWNNRNHTTRGRQSTSQSQSTTKSRNASNNSATSKSTTTKKKNDMNIFFRLEARILAKMFRTKPALCGQPVSMNIEGTIFCCRSVLLNPNPTHHQTQDDNMSVTSKQRLKELKYCSNEHLTTLKENANANFYLQLLYI